LPIAVDIPGRAPLALEHAVLDVNGTLTRAGELLAGTAERLRALAAAIELHLLTADTFGTAEAIAAELGVPLERISHGNAKRWFVERLGAEHCVAIGNGTNDAEMFEAAALSIAIVGPEGASLAALRIADLACRSINDALDLLGDPRMLVATLRP
jgi:P-type E1-E2 ATPase